MSQHEFRVETDESDEFATAAFQTAIDECGEAGGGRVVVPAGEYAVGTVRLRSNVTLHLAAGATVAAAADEDAYDASHVGPDDERPFLLAEGVENVALTGRGTFDGRGTEFMLMDTPIRGHSGEADTHPLVTSGPPRARQGDAYLDREGPTDDWPVAKPDFRPGPMFLFDGCQNVLVRDVTLRDMPAWTLSIEDTVEADVRGIDVVGNKRIPNNDGIAITNSQNVHISDCTLVTCDDSICLNGTLDSPRPCENVTVTNCTIESNACAIKFGSQTAGPIRNATFENIVIRDSNRGLGIQHRDGGDIENVLFSNIIVETRLVAGPWWGKAEPIYVTSVPRDTDTDLGAVRNVRFSNVVADVENGALVYGAPGATIENVGFENVRIGIDGGEKSDLVGGNFDLQPTAVGAPIFEHDIPGIHCEGLSSLSVTDSTVEWADDDLPAYFSHGLQCEEVSGVTIDGFTARGAGEDDAAIRLARCERASVRGSTAAPGTDVFLSVTDLSDQRVLGLNDTADARTPTRGDVSGFST